MKVFRKIFKLTPDYVDGKFFIRQGKNLIATPLFVVLLFVESTDVMFAVDSIPAIIAITRDPFIAETLPSIISLGATISAPASAWVRASSQVVQPFHHKQFHTCPGQPP